MRMTTALHVLISFVCTSLSRDSVFKDGEVQQLGRTRALEGCYRSPGEDKVGGLILGMSGQIVRREPDSAGRSFRGVGGREAGERVRRARLID
eukprot:1390166-Pleurochrysis_carterae.AAC.3